MVDGGEVAGARLAATEGVGELGVVAGDHVAEVVGDELGTTTALFAAARA